MYNFLTKNGQLVAFVVGTLISLAFYAMVNSGLEEFTALDLAKDPERFKTTIFDFGLQTARVLTGLGAILILLFGLYHTATNPKSAIKFILGIALVAIVFAIAYNMAGGEVKESWTTDFGVTPGISKFVEGSIFTTLALIGITVAIFVLGEVRNFFK